ncbi:EpsG family protein [Alishewanella sp. 16-MA]|uniref:EpsG family protein n=1 Tax=Alishewanella maricola TaxID=2795740 RepID=A0ABS8C162_9ALTE|nr:EpsG family protein [Alishewanella maricola]MCB5226066.1 EpsG family protein [Alishewanella maricola]
MIFYLFPVYFSAMFFFSSLLKVKINFFISLMISAVVVIIAGFRYFSDTDYEAYYDIFHSLPSLAMLEYHHLRDTYGELGYLLLNVAVKSLNLDFYVVTLVCAFISISGKFFFVTKFSYSAPLVLTCYLCLHFVTTEFSELRWSVATSLILLSFYFSFKNNKFLVFTFTFSSLMFHYSTFLIIPLLLFHKIISRQLLYIIFIFSFLVALFYKFIGFSVAVDFGDTLYALARLQRYLNDPDSNVGFFSLAKLFFFFVVIFSLNFLANSTKFLDREHIFLEKIALGLSSIALIFSLAPVFFLRLAPLFDLIFLVIIFRRIFQLNTKSTKIIFSFLLVFAFSLWQLISLPRSLSTPLTEGGLATYQMVIFN